ncbi:MAG: GatB/YqeY domain-containing protein [Vicinamibacterales bacterium]
MTLTDTISADIARAMKARDATTLAALRMLKTALTNKSIERGRALDGTEELQVVNALVKQRKDSIEQFDAAGRHDLSAKERAEIAVLDAYLPPAVGDEDLAAAIDTAIAATGAAGPKDMGRVMKAVMSALSGRTIDGKRVNELVRARLT